MPAPTTQSTGDRLSRPRSRVVVAIPVWNGERFLGAAIESVLAQGFGDFDLVVSDNASIDGTEEICRQFAREDSRVHYFRNPSNLGAAPNFNRCVELAGPCCEYFKWLPADDLIEEDFLETCVGMLEADLSIAIAFPVRRYIDEHGEVIGEQRDTDLTIAMPASWERVRRLMELARRGPDIFWTMYGVVRRDAIFSTRGHGSYVASDQVFLLELLFRGTIVQVSGSSFLSRSHDGAWTSKARTPRASASWFDTGSGSKVVLPHWTLMAQHYRAVMLSDLPPREKLLCLRAITGRTIHEWRNLGGDAKYVVRTAITGRSRPIAHDR